VVVAGWRRLVVVAVAMGCPTLRTVGAGRSRYESMEEAVVIGQIDERAIRNPALQMSFGGHVDTAVASSGAGQLSGSATASGQRRSGALAGRWVVGAPGVGVTR